MATMVYEKNSAQRKQAINEKYQFCPEERKTCLHVLACKNRRQRKHQFEKELIKIIKKYIASNVNTHSRQY